MIEYMKIKKDMTIMVPDSDAVEGIIETYQKGSYGMSVDFMGRNNRYIWLYRIMYNCVSVIETERKHA